MNQVMKLRRELALSIRATLIDMRCSQAQAARTLGTTQPRISNLFRSRIEGIGTEQLVEWLETLGRSVEVRIVQSEESKQTDRRYWLLEQGRASLEAGHLWAALAIANNLSIDYRSFRPGRALKHDVLVALGSPMEAAAYRADKEAEEFEVGS